jgi:enoyl-CoA hydratase
MALNASSEPSLIVEGRLATIALNNPRRLNVIGPEEIEAVASALRTAVADPTVATIVIRGEGDRGFCAGGDIKRVRHMIASGDLDQLAEFWSTEYRLDHLIATCPKPVVSIAHGLTLGGGMGLTAHASHRVVTDSTRMGMPEVLIGLCPDLGGLWLFGRAPGHSGAFAALTAAHLTAGDALYMGLADYLVPDERIGTLVERLHRLPVDDALDGFDDRAPSWVADNRDDIDVVFGAGSVLEIAEMAKSAETKVAELALEALETASPTALCVTLEALRKASAMPFLADCLEQDLRVGQHCARHPDLSEGIRARVVDKDRMPKWSPSNPAEVSSADVEGFFQPIGTPLHVDGW